MLKFSMLKDNEGDTRNRLDHACLQKIGINALGLTILDAYTSAMYVLS